MMGAIFRNLIYPGWHSLKRDGVNQVNRRLDRNQWLSLDEILAVQQAKLNELLSFAGKNVPYYRKVAGRLDIDLTRSISLDDFRRLPSLTKSIIRQEGDALVSEDLAGNGLIANSTSGSTGEVLRFYTDHRSVPYRKAAGLRSNFWTGWRLGDRQSSLWGAPIDAKRASRLRGRMHSLVTGRQFLSSFDLSPSRMDHYVQRILQFKPTLFIAYPGPMELFAMHCIERGVSLPSLRAIVSSAETLWPHQREVIEAAFRVRVYNRYGCREVGQVGAECSEHDGLHISADRFFMEVVDDAGQPCPANVQGKILVTDLDNFGMPLIRYDIGDLGAWSDSESCSCGRGLPLLQKIEGRTMDIVRTPNGRQFGGTFWTLMLRSRPGLRQFQVVQDKLDGVVINFVPDSDFDRAVLDYFRTRIQEYCGRDLTVQFVEQSSIDLTVSGKRRLIISRLSNSAADHSVA